jgi:hypothetical protein
VNAKLTDRIVMSSVLDQISRNTWIIRYTTYDGLTENIGAQDRISTQVLEIDNIDEIPPDVLHTNRGEIVSGELLSNGKFKYNWI